MKTIDAHHHFWNYTPEEFAWLSDDMATLRRDYLHDELKPQLDAAGVDGVISVEARSTLDENGFLLGLAAKHDWIVGVVGKTPLIQGEDSVRKHLESLLPQPKLVGVRDVLQGSPAGFTRGAEFNDGLAVLHEFDLRFDLCIYENQLPEIIELVDRHPDQLFVLDHIGKPRIRDHALEPWAERIRELARRPHVSCKLSGMVTEADPQAWTAEQLHPFMDVAVEAFGPGRLMLGTDWPVCRLGCEYADWTHLVRDYASRLSASEQSSLFEGAAMRAYAIELP